MADRYGDRDFDRFDERREGDYEDDERGGLFGRGTDHGSTWRSPRLARDYDEHERDAGPRPYGRDYYDSPRTGTPGGGYYGAGHPGRDYDRAARDEPRHERPRARDYEQAYDRGEDDRDRDRGERRGYETDYGRTTSRFFGRDRGETLRGQVPPDYGRDDDEGDRERDYERRSERGYGARYGGGPDYGDHERRGYEAYRSEREHRDRGRPHHREEERGGHGRGWIDRAADEVLSWFGDEDAERRRRSEGAHGYRGRGPKNYRRSDERIREDISDRLTEHEYLDASDIEVTVVGGEVILSGTVDNRHAKRLAEDIAESVIGVSNVQNNLRVQRERRASAGADLPPGTTASAATYTPGLAGLGSGPGADVTASPSGATGTTAASDAGTTGIDTDGSTRAAGSGS